MMWIVVPRLIARMIGMIPDKWNIGPRITAGVAIDRRSTGRTMPVSSSYRASCTSPMKQATATECASARWLIKAALGKPVVPEVNNTMPGDSGSSTAGVNARTGWATTRSA